MTSENGERARRAFFDTLAPEWRARGFPGDEAAQVARLRERLGPLEGLRVLEPGCGTGRLTALLAGWVGPRGRVTAVDIAPRMVAEARETIRDLPGPLRDVIDLREADATTLALDEESQDLALLFCVFPHFEDRGGALRHFAATLCRGGRLVIAHLEGSERLNAFHEGAGPAVRRDRIPPEPELRSMVENAGLRPDIWIDRDLEFYLEAVKP